MRKVTFAIFALLVVALIGAFVYAKTPAGYAQAQFLANKTGLSNKVQCIYTPNQQVPFDTLDRDALRKWNPAVHYAVNPNNLSVEKTSEGGVFRQRFVPSDEGSERVIWAVDLEARSTYELKQRFFFEEGFDWGGTSESGKFGFGFGGGSAPTGGKTAKDGFTARLAWHGRGDGTTNVAVYAYSADRTQNLPYGDMLEIPNFVIPTGEWVDVTIRLTVNSELDTSDGKLTVQINDELLLDRDAIQWQTEGEKPTIDRLIFSTFHGGNTPDWTPDETVYARFTDICLFD